MIAQLVAYSNVLSCIIVEQALQLQRQEKLLKDAGEALAASAETLQTLVDTMFEKEV